MARHGKVMNKAVDTTSGDRVILPGSEQVSRGQELLEILREPVASAAAPDACFSDECVDRDVKVIVRNTFVEVVDPVCKRRSRAMSDSALFRTSNERALLFEPLPTMTDLSDVSTEVSENPEASQPEDPNVYNGGNTGADGYREGTCWADQDMDEVGGIGGMDEATIQYMQQQPYVAYEYVESWWMPMNFDGTTVFMPQQQWAGQSGVECEVADAEGADQEWRTTVMLRNMPNNYTRDMLLELVDSMGFELCYDFAYLPVDFKSQAGLGYAFINFVSSEEAQRCFDCFEGFSDWKVPSEKVCTVTWGSPYQGLEAHVERYQNSPVMHHSIPDEWKPVLFDQQGLRVPFPAPTKAIKTPKVRAQAASS